MILLSQPLHLHIASPKDSESVATTLVAMKDQAWYGVEWYVEILPETLGCASDVVNPPGPCSECQQARHHLHGHAATTSKFM